MNDRIVKKEKYCRVCSNCFSCSSKTQCIRSSSLAEFPRKFFIRHLGYHQEKTPAMIQGTLIHEEFFKMYPTVNQLGAIEFIKKVYSGEEVFVREFACCSCREGLNGHMDLLQIKYDPSTKTFNFIIHELKSKPWKEYEKQVVAYASIISDPNFLFHFTLKLPRSEKIMAERFYQIGESYGINIITKFIYYNKKNKNGENKTQKKIRVKDNVFMDKNNQFAMLHKRKKFRECMGAGEFYLTKMPMCGICWKDKCGFYWLCKKYAYSKDIQYHMGKRKVIKKSK